MTELERIIRHFNDNVKPCASHPKSAVTIAYDGCWFIECESGCEIHDGDNVSPTPLIRRYRETGFRPIESET